MNENAKRWQFGRQKWVVVSNALMCLEVLVSFCRGIYFDRSFGASLARYGVPLPSLGESVLRAIPHEMPLFLVAALLVWGGMAEARRRPSAAIVNPIAYLLVVLGVVWDAGSVPRDEHFIPMLEAELPNLLIATVNLVLYRKEIACKIRRLDPRRHGQ